VMEKIKITWNAEDSFPLVLCQMVEGRPRYTHLTKKEAEKIRDLVSATGNCGPNCSCNM
jgi:hypothetical protein